jgi:putative transcriptional regulator
MPQVLDPFFHKSVVLLIHQDDDGSFGLILNRKTALTLAEVLEGLEIPWGGDAEAQAFFGGPVQPQIGTVLFPTTRAAGAETGLDATAECAPGIALTHHVSDLGKLAHHPPDGLRLFLGYAGWGAGQLVQEILRDDWLIAPVREDLVFADEPDDVWESALASVGVDPATLPSWSTRGENGGDDRAN